MKLKIIKISLALLIIIGLIIWYIMSPKKTTVCSSVVDDNRCFEYLCTGIGANLLSAGSPHSFLGSCKFVREISQ